MEIEGRRKSAERENSGCEGEGGGEGEKQDKGKLAESR